MPKAKSAKVAILCAVLNTIIPGLGCMILACIGDARQIKWSMDKTSFFCGFIQLLLIPYIVGYAFGAYWSYLIVIQYRKPENKMLKFVSRYCKEAVEAKQLSLSKKLDVQEDQEDTFQRAA